MRLARLRKRNIECFPSTKVFDFLGKNGSKLPNLGNTKPGRVYPRVTEYAIPRRGKGDGSGYELVEMLLSFRDARCTISFFLHFKAGCMRRVQFENVVPSESVAWFAFPSGDFRFWEVQEEDIDRGYLQIASYIEVKERAQLASRMEGKSSRVCCRLHLARLERMNR